MYSGCSCVAARLETSCVTECEYLAEDEIKCSQNLCWIDQLELGRAERAMESPESGHSLVQTIVVYSMTCLLWNWCEA